MNPKSPKVAAKLLPTPAPPISLQKTMQRTHKSPLLIIDEQASRWLEFLACGRAWSDWEVAGISPQELHRQHPLLKSGGHYWLPQGGTIEVPRWKPVAPPWTHLLAWWLRELPLKSRQVSLLCPHPLGSLTGWLATQCACLATVQSHARNLESLLRLSDLVIVLPGFEHPLEVHHFCPGVILLDLRPNAPNWPVTALAQSATALACPQTGSLRPLLACLSLVQQETPWELA